MGNPYEKCPVYQNEKYLLRLVEPADAPDLLSVYSDENAVPYFNSDNCGGDDFHYTSLERVQGQIRMWLSEYRRKAYVRWAILDRERSCAIGTIELFNRKSEDYFNDCGLLRLDLRSDYEKEEAIFEILSLIVPPAFELFDCRFVATKIPPFAADRKAAAEQLGFRTSAEKLIGHHDQKIYMDYYVLL